VFAATPHHPVKHVSFGESEILGLRKDCDRMTYGVPA